MPLEGSIADLGLAAGTGTMVLKFSGCSRQPLVRVTMPNKSLEPTSAAAAIASKVKDVQRVGPRANH